MKGFPKYGAVALGLTLGAASLLQAQEADKFKLYGFMDASIAHYDVADSYMNRIIGDDAWAVNLNHVNTYLDWRPNPTTRALVEIGFLSKASKTVDNGTSEGTVFTLGGQVVSRADAIQAATFGAIQGMGLDPSDPADAPAIAQITSLISNSVNSLDPSADPNYTGNNSSSQEAVPVNVERAQFDILVSDLINFRVGKFLTPAGIWNTEHASPVVLTVSQPYETFTTPIFPEAQTGFMAFGRTFLGDHDLGYNLYLTSGRSGANQGLGAQFNNSIDKLTDLAVGGHLGLNLDVLSGVGLGVSAMTGTLRREYVAQVTHIAVEQLQNYALTNTEFEPRLIHEDREFVMGGDAKIEIGNALVQGEVNYQILKYENTDIASNAPSAGASHEATNLGFYGLIGYRLPIGETMSLTPYAMYEQVEWTNMDDVRSIELTGWGLNGFQSTIVGLNWALNSNVRIKTEYNLVRLLASDDDGPDFGGFKPPTGFKEGDLDATIISTQFAVAF